MKLQNIKLVCVFILSVAAVASPGFAAASENSGTIDSTYKYAWSENIGWINFGCDSCNVTVTDSAITGYAWSENYGWINLNPSGSGVTNNSSGTLGGQAWGENTGWIDFDGVTIDSSGYFNGYANGTVTGQVSFNCSNTDSCSSSDFKVRTDWRPSSEGGSSGESTTTSGGGGGGLPPVAYTQPAEPAMGFGVVINNGAETTDSRQVTLSFDVGSNVERIAISNTGDFEDASQEKYSPIMEWDLCSKFGGLIKSPVCPEGEYTVHVKFYTKYGRASKVVSDKVIYKKPEKPLLDSEPLESEPSEKEPDKRESFVDTFVFSRSLRLGDRGNDVKALQKFLNSTSGFKLTSSGPGSPGNETEFFGSLTFVALKKYQEAYKEQILIPVGLTRATGFFGPSTIRFINSLGGVEEKEVVRGAQSAKRLLFRRGLGLGMTDTDVRLLQKSLSTLDGIYPEKLVTGFFGPLTEKAVQRFQLKYGIVKNSNSVGYGYVGPSTRKKLNEIFGE